MPYYYKVTLEELVSSDAMWCKTQYIDGEFVEANPIMAGIGYHLCVFETLEYAIRYIERSRYYRIWLCECEDEVPIPEKLHLLPYMSDNLTREIAVEVKRCSIKTPSLPLKSYSYQWPKGTRMFKRVKLVEEVDIQECLIRGD